ncbi:MAG: PGPGW domain-containing protein [Kofleriaceae bacterium]
MSALATEWRTFRADTPGERFCHHFERSKRASRAAKIGRVSIGIVLIAVGIALLFLPGPGLLFALFGVALLSAQSERLSRGLDRGELWVRRTWRRLRKRG